MGRSRWEVSRSNTCITAQIVFQWALGSLMFWKLFGEFFKICACQDKLEDKVNPRCLWTVTSSIILLCKINWGFWGWNGLSLFALKTTDLVLDSFIVTNHRLARSHVDFRSWLSLDAQSLGDWIFSSKKQSSINKQRWEENVAGRSLM